MTDRRPIQAGFERRGDTNCGMCQGEGKLCAECGGDVLGIDVAPDGPPCACASRLTVTCEHCDGTGRLALYAVRIDAP